MQLERRGQKTNNQMTQNVSFQSHTYHYKQISSSWAGRWRFPGGEAPRCRVSNPHASSSHSGTITQHPTRPFGSYTHNNSLGIGPPRCSATTKRAQRTPHLPTEPPHRSLYNNISSPGWILRNSLSRGKNPTLRDPARPLDTPWRSAHFGTSARSI